MLESISNSWAGRTILFINTMYLSSMLHGLLAFPTISMSPWMWVPIIRNWIWHHSIQDTWILTTYIKKGVIFLIESSIFNLTWQYGIVEKHSQIRIFDSWYYYSRLPITWTLANLNLTLLTNSNQNHFPMDFLHTVHSL